MELTRKQVRTAIILSVGLFALSLAVIGHAAPASPASRGSAAPPSYYLGQLVSIGGTGADEQPFAQQGADGSLEAAFITRRYGNPPQIAYSRSTDGGASWSAAIQVSQSTGSAAPVGSVSLVQDSVGATHLLYSTLSSNGGNSVLWYAQRSSGVWQTPTTILASQYANTAVGIGSTASGLYTVLLGDYNAKPQISRSTDGGNTWAATTDINSVSASGHGLDLAQSGDDLFFAYADIFGDGARIRARYLGQSAWQDPETVAIPGLRGAYYPSAAITGGNIYLSFCGWSSIGGDLTKDLFVTVRPLTQPGAWAAPIRLTQLPAGQDCNGTQLRYDAGSAKLLLLYQVTQSSGNQSADNLYLTTTAPGGSFDTPQQLTSFTLGEGIVTLQLLPTTSGWGIAFGYYNAATSSRYAYFASLFADNQPTPTPPLPATATSTPAGSPTPIPSPTHGICVVPFTDLDGNYYAAEIASLYCRGFISGVDPTHFGPQLPATRAQFIKLLVVAFGVPVATPAVPSFNDVPPNHWAYQYIEGAKRGYLVTGYHPEWCWQKGYGYPCYGAEVSLTRAQLARMVIGATGLDCALPSDPIFADVPTTHWAFAEIERIGFCEGGLMHGSGDGSFVPNGLARRDILAHVLYMALNISPDKLPNIERAKHH